MTSRCKQPALRARLRVRGAALPHSAAGLTAYGWRGELIAGGTLPEDVVRAAFEFSAAHDVPLCGFLGEECVTHKMHPELEELHHRWVLRSLLLCCHVLPATALHAALPAAALPVADGLHYRWVLRSMLRCLLRCLLFCVEVRFC